MRGRPEGIFIKGKSIACRSYFIYDTLSKGGTVIGVQKRGSFPGNVGKDNYLEILFLGNLSVLI